MKTHFTFKNLHQAYLDCRKRKSNSFYCQQFDENLEENLFTLKKELENRTYKPGRSIAFIVQKPKIREIFAADFRDRVIHHLLFNYLSPIFEKVFIHDSWACRKDKGTHRAMLRLQEFAVKLEREPFDSAQGKRDGASPSSVIARGNEAIYHDERLPRQPKNIGLARNDKSFYLKMDIKSFFTSIDQQILYNLIVKRVKNEEILWLTKTIIFHDCARDVPPKIQSRPSLFDKLPVDKSLFTAQRGKGLPIGNLTSQFFANVYMNALDQFVKHTLKAKYYLRYVDDFLILGNDKSKLAKIEAMIMEFVRDELTLKTSPKKCFIRSISSGIDFVGYVVRPDYVLVRKRVVGDWRRKMKNAKTEEVKKQIFDAYSAHAIWANAYRLRQKMLTNYD